VSVLIPRGVLIAGGGTAGHVLPGLAIAEALVNSGVVENQSSVYLVGSRRGIEVDLVPPTGFDLTVLPGRGIQRRLALANLAAGIGLLCGFVQALILVIRRRPAVVVSLGGYASIPCALAALVLRVPVVVAEQNAVPGAANRLTGRFARACAVSFPGTDLPRSTMTGNPVRQGVRKVAESGDRIRDRSEARAALGVNTCPFVVVFGGSLGARRINQALVRAVEDWKGGPVVVEHVVGPRGWMKGLAGGVLADDAPERTVAAAPDVEYRAVRYEADMLTVLRAADLVVCRAGATSVAELSALGVPSILVPLPEAPGDHQTANARYLEDAGGALLVPDSELDGDRLGVEMAALLADTGRLTAMANGARSLGRPDAADRVVALITTVVSGGVRSKLL
jgi:UDP-N-acetylglucosamine--N-acetylmuramyl-(pentapeptide) pyrophosphoryl-undecaprenol N-acetylglucosamine transferase